MNRRGFTLIEVMVSLAIVSGLLMVIITSMNYHLDTLNRYKNSLLLTSLAKDRLETLKVNKQSEKGEFPEPFKGVSYQTEIKDSDYPDIKELTVKVKGAGDEIVITELILWQGAK